MADEHRFYWLKLKRDFFKRHDIRIIEEMPNGKDYILFYLKLLCESIDHEGTLRFSEKIPYNENMLATITNTNVDIVRAAVKIFDELGMMEVLDDGTYFMCEVMKMTGSAVDNDGANRVRRFRENQKLKQLEAGSVTKCNGAVTGDVTEDNESKNKSKSENKSKSQNNTPKPDFAAIIAESTENEELRTAINEFVEYRKRIKKPIVTEHTLRLLIKGLNKLGQTDAERIEVLNQSMVNGWQGIFALKKEVKEKAEKDAKQAEHDAMWAERLKRCINI